MNGGWPSARRMHPLCIGSLYGLPPWRFADEFETLMPEDKGACIGSPMPGRAAPPIF